MKIQRTTNVTQKRNEGLTDDQRHSKRSEGLSSTGLTDRFSDINILQAANMSRVKPWTTSHRDPIETLRQSIEGTQKRLEQLEPNLGQRESTPQDSAIAYPYVNALSRVVHPCVKVYPSV